MISRFRQAVDEVLFLPFRVQLVLALLTAFVVAFCVGFPFAVLGLVLEMEFVQHFLRSLGSWQPPRVDGVVDSDCSNSMQYIWILHSHHLRTLVLKASTIFQELLYLSDAVGCSFSSFGQPERSFWASKELAWIGIRLKWTWINPAT